MIVHEWYKSVDYTVIERGAGGNSYWNYWDWYPYRDNWYRNWYPNWYRNWNRNYYRDRMLKSVPPQCPPRSGARTLRLTADQEAVLQEQFNRWPKALHTADIVLLAAETGLSETDVQDWYNIRLAQWRKEQGLGGSLGLH